MDVSHIPVPRLMHEVAYPGKEIHAGENEKQNAPDAESDEDPAEYH